MEIMEDINQETTQSMPDNTPVDSPIEQDSPSESFTETHSEDSTETNHFDTEGPDYLKKRLGQQARRFEQQNAALKRQFDEVTYTLQQVQRQQQYPNNQTQQEDMDLTNPDNFITAVNELVKHQINEKENMARQNEFHKKIEKTIGSARSKYQDIDDLAQDVVSQHGPIPNGFVESLPLLKNAEDVMYQIFRSPSEYTKLLGKSPYEVIHRLTEISHQLASKSNTVSKVQPPIKILSASGNSVNNNQKSCTEKRAELREQYRNKRKR
jgi:hypothetical protein